MARSFVRHGVGKLRLTGGEPLLRKGIEGLIAKLALIPEVEDLTLTTNGASLDRKARDLAAAGLRRVTVSLDSMDDIVFTAMNDVGLGDAGPGGAHAVGPAIAPRRWIGSLVASFRLPMAGGDHRHRLGAPGGLWSIGESWAAVDMTAVEVLVGILAVYATWAVARRARDCRRAVRRPADVGRHLQLGRDKQDRTVVHCNNCGRAHLEPGLFCHWCGAALGRPSTSSPRRSA